MAWIKSNQNLLNHPKLLKLCKLADWSKEQAIGELHIFWWWVLDYAEDGDLSRVDLSVPIGNMNLKFLVDCEFIDAKDLKVHDWFFYAGKYLSAKYHTNNPKKLRAIERKYRSTYRLNKGMPKGGIYYPLDRQIKIDLDRQKEKSIADSKSAKQILKKSKKETDPLLKSVINHICDKWKDKRGNKLYFTGKHAKLIQGLCKAYDHSSIMALWDLYLIQDEDFYRKCGYSIECFITSMPKLLDLPYKSISKKYENILYPEIVTCTNPLSKLNIEIKEIPK